MPTSKVVEGKTWIYQIKQTLTERDDKHIVLATNPFVPLRRKTIWGRAYLSKNMVQATFTHKIKNNVQPLLISTLKNYLLSLSILWIESCPTQWRNSRKKSTWSTQRQTLHHSKVIYRKRIHQCTKQKGLKTCNSPEPLIKVSEHKKKKKARHIHYIENMNSKTHTTSFVERGNTPSGHYYKQKSDLKSWSLL